VVHRTARTVACLVHGGLARRSLAWMTTRSMTRDWISLSSLEEEQEVLLGEVEVGLQHLWLVC